jgi:hypothetical protein
MANPSSVASAAFGEPERYRRVGYALRVARGTQIATTTERRLSDSYAHSRHDGPAQVIAPLATTHAARLDVVCERETQTEGRPVGSRHIRTAARCSRHGQPPKEVMTTRHPVACRHGAHLEPDILAGRPHRVVGPDQDTERPTSLGWSEAQPLGLALPRRPPRQRLQRPTRPPWREVAHRCHRTDITATAALRWRRAFHRPLP